MLSRERGFDQGFQTYVELWRKPRAAGKTVDMEGAEVVATQLSSRERKSPLFLFVNLIGPHSPYTSCGKFCDRYVSDPSIKASEAEVIDFYLRERRYSAEELRHLNELYDAEILQVDELVGARVRVRGTELHRVADLAEALEADALDHAAVRDVEAGDQARERHRSRKRAPAAPLFSGWNWTPRKLPDSATATTPSERAVAAGVSAAYECAK